MNITNLTNRPLTATELKSLNTLACCVIPGHESAAAFALIGNECIIPINRKRHPDQASQIAEAKRIAASACSYPPDFSAGVWKDGTGYVYMNGETGAVYRVVYDLSKGERDYAHMDLGRALDARGVILDACKDTTIIALAYCEKGES